MRKLFILLLFVSFLSCNQEDIFLNIEQDELSNTPSLNSSLIYSIFDVNGGDGNYNYFIEQILEEIYKDPIGEYIIDMMLLDRGKIFFEIDPTLSYRVMKVRRVGNVITVRCNILPSLGKSLYESLIFHEIFHYCQAWGDEWNLNNEVEAYVALLRYSERNAGTGVPMELLDELAKVQSSWEELDGTSRKKEKFNTAYENAIKALRRYDADYNNMGEDYSHRHLGTLDRVEQDAYEYIKNKKD